jgi:hypothetical protein
VETGRKVIRLSMLPADTNLIDGKLAELRISTISRNASIEDLTMLFRVFGDLCAEYPADVAVDALRWWARNEKFWPALSELKVELDRRVKKRRLMLAALESTRD